MPVDAVPGPGSFPCNTPHSADAIFSSTRRDGARHRATERLDI